MSESIEGWLVPLILGVAALFFVRLFFMDRQRSANDLDRMPDFWPAWFKRIPGKLQGRGKTPPEPDGSESKSHDQMFAELADRAVAEVAEIGSGETAKGVFVSKGLELIDALDAETARLRNGPGGAESEMKALVLAKIRRKTMKIVVHRHMNNTCGWIRSMLHRME